MKYLFISLLCFCFIQDIDSRPKQSLGDTTVYLFLLHDCVICESYAPSLEALYSAFGDRFSFLGVFPNFISKKKDIESFASKYRLTIPMKTDYFKTLTNKFGVEVTPTAVIFDHRNNEILYKGRIDDEFISIGKRKSVITNYDLKDALEALVLSKEYQKNTQAVGCLINFGDLKY